MTAEAVESGVLKLERDGAVAVVTLNRPDRLNALNMELNAALLDTMAELKEDDDIRAVILAGAGRGFCSGADVKGFVTTHEEPSQTTRLDEMGWVGKQALAMSGLDKPVIGAINGIATGAGMSLALACDIRIGGPGAAFRCMFIERSLSPDAGMTYFLTRIVGYPRAAELVFSSRTVHAEEAAQIGLLNKVVPDGELLPAAMDLAGQIAKWPPLALRASKRVLQHNLECDLAEALLYERSGLRMSGLATADRQEAGAAFVERRPPIFTGH